MNKTILVTGASTGIGKEIAITYAKNNYNLVLVARSDDKLKELQNTLEQEYKINVETISLDLSKLDSAENLFEIVKSKNLKIDILINNAGFGLNGDFITIDLTNQTNMMMLNMVTLTKLSRLFIDEMLEQDSGHIVNIASTAAFQPVPSFAVYAATKAYVLSFSEAISQELKSENINVTAICPGATESNFLDTAGVKKVNFISMATSKQVAEFTFKKVNTKKVVAVHGLINNLIVFSLRFTPRSIVRKAASLFFD